jgi:hypothetical protein
MTDPRKELLPCCKCIFWNEINGITYDNEVWGDCHRYPAKVKKSTKDWCGEFSCSNRRAQ